MSRRGANWYPREPHAFLGGVRGLTSKLTAVYSIILDLIYDGGGECPNDPKWISGWFSDLGPASVRKAISDLCDIGKLAVDGDVLTNKRATIEAKTDRETREKRSESGRKGGLISGESRAKRSKSEANPEEKQDVFPSDSFGFTDGLHSDRSVTTNDNNDLNEASASTKNEADKSTVQKKEKREGKPSPKKGSRLSEDWTLPKPWGEWAVQQQLSEKQVRDQGERFLDYWIGVPGPKGVKLNWQATWRNWIRSAVARGDGYTNGSTRPRQPTASDGIRAELRAQDEMKAAGVGR